MVWFRSLVVAPSSRFIPLRMAFLPYFILMPSMAASEIYARDSMSAQASLMGQLQTRGFSYRDEAELRRRLQSVDAAQVQAAARLLTPERQTVVVVQPE